MNIVLWIIQVLLALLFLFAGGMKLVLPIDVLTSMGPPNQVQLARFVFKVHRRVRSARRTRSNPARTLPG